MSRFAFPTPEYFEVTAVQSTEGLTKREIFAALALAGLMAADGEINSAMVRDAVVAAELLLDQLGQSEITQ